ncbi:hypothetical protein CC78DRAFT_528227 [Lojkania enalia]|uniref:Ubiquitin-conjugating enzyme E2-binding protein n=1 Tax=Lojkania enalia TaxID=147567 RepID=A0A9P4NC06_9PLEO|nr:hypothetical protein CC78DRAFT_528227 [Didymosphaeria enalia]
MPPTMLPTSAYEALGLPSDEVRVLTGPNPSAPTATSAASPNVLQAQPAAAGPLGPNESNITLYAELLLHIRTIALFASLHSLHTRETKAKLSADGSSITVTHEGESATTRLPIKVKGSGDAALSLPAKPPSKELTLRLEIGENEGSNFFGAVQAEERKVNIVPWDGSSLNSKRNLEIRCRLCENPVVPCGKIREWRDLPSENWAEMMDFWHCHKPDEHHLHDHTHEETMGKKGYAAGNRLTAVNGVGFIDLVSFLLKEQDCIGIELSTKADSSELESLCCKECRHILGTPDEPADGWRIWKWSIGIKDTVSPSTPSMSTFTVRKWISARFLYLIENTGLRKFHVHPDTPSSPSSSASTPMQGLLLWVFTPDLIFSSSRGRRDPTRAMKVFYQEKNWMSSKDGAQESSSVEEVAFPREFFEELRRGLREGGSLLPVGARWFQGWKVGLLERFDVGEGA